MADIPESLVALAESTPGMEFEIAIEGVDDGRVRGHGVLWSAIPCGARQDECSTGTPDAVSLRIATIWCSVNRDFFKASFC